MDDLFDYEFHSNFDAAQAEKLESMPRSGRLTAGLMSIHGIRKSIVTQEEGLQALHNLLVSLLMD